MSANKMSELGDSLATEPLFGRIFLCLELHNLTALHAIQPPAINPCLKVNELKHFLTHYAYYLISCFRQLAVLFALKMNLGRLSSEDHMGLLAKHCPLILPQQHLLLMSLCVNYIEST